MLPRDEDAAADAIAPLVRSVDPAAESPELVVLTADPGTAVSLARATAAEGSPRLVPVSAEHRGVRVLTSRSVVALAGPPSVLLALVRSAVLKLDRVRIVALVWADDILAIGEGPALETIMSEVPKDANRVLVAATLGPEVEELAERYLRRARRIVPPEAGPSPAAVSYVPVSAAGRTDALRRVLDEVNPPRAAIFARTDRGLVDARAATRDLGYDDGDPILVVTSGAPVSDASLLVLYELPESGEQLQSLVGIESPRIIALVRPRDVERLRAIASGAVTPLTPRDATAGARRRDELAREELRAEVQRGLPDWQLIALEPLLDEFDPIEIAAAALRLRAREKESSGETRVSRTPPEPPASRQGAWTRLFLTTGSRDNIRPGDLVGMITAEAGITGDKIGKIELRESHSLVEVAADVADSVVARINGAQVKGRRIVARPERDREERGARPRGGHRPPRRSGESHPPRA